VLGYELCAPLTGRGLVVAFYETDDEYIGCSQGFLSRTQQSYFWTANVFGFANPLQNY
jgi:predicted N-acyltransferase